MELLVNVAPLIPPRTGIGRYTEQILLHLLENDNVGRIAGFTGGQFYEQQQLKKLLYQLENQQNKSPERYVSVIEQLKQVVKKIPASVLIKRKIQDALLNKKFKHYKNYIYWEPNYILRPFDGYTATTIHDLSHIHYPQFHPQSRVKWLNDKLPETLERASVLIAVSEFSKQEIVEIFGVKPELIQIVSPAVSSDFHQSATLLEQQELKQKYNLPENFILSVATLEPRKNIIALIQAFSRLDKSLRKQYPLVLAGCNGWLSDELNKYAIPLIQKKELIRLGYVAQQDLPILHQAATLFVYISLYEGFGMPIAEAMASGTAVLTSSQASMPEVASGSAQLVNPRDVEQVSIEIQELLENTEKRKRLECQGKVISQTYTWEKSAKKLMRVFNNIQNTQL